MLYRKPQSSSANFAMSSAVSSQDTTSALARIRSSLTDFGSGTKPLCKDHRSSTCAGVRPRRRNFADDLVLQQSGAAAHLVRAGALGGEGLPE